MGLLRFLFGEREQQSADSQSLERIQREMKELKKDLRAAAANQQPSESRYLGSDDEIQQALQDLRETEGLDELQEARAEEFLRARQILQESLTIAQETKNPDTRSNRLDVASKNLERLEHLSELIDCPFSLDPKPVWQTINGLLASDIEELNDEEPEVDYVPDHYLGKSWGEIFAELTGGANLVDGKQTWEHADSGKNDLETMLQCCHAELKSQEASHGRHGPAPYYFERAAILFRKAKCYEEEIKICEVYLSAIKNDNYFFEISPRVKKIKHRLPKAKQLAAKAKHLPQA